MEEALGKYTTKVKLSFQQSRNNNKKQNIRENKDDYEQSFWKQDDVKTSKRSTSTHQMDIVKDYIIVNKNIDPYLPSSIYDEDESKKEVSTLYPFEEIGNVSATMINGRDIMNQPNNLDKGQNFTCHQYNFSSPHRGPVKRHIKFIHEKINNHTYDQCGYASVHKCNLVRHINDVHKQKIRKPKVFLRLVFPFLPFHILYMSFCFNGVN